MIYQPISPRPDWKEKAEAMGFMQHTNEDGSEYWHDGGHYRLTKEQATTLQQATEQMHQMFHKAVRVVLDSNDLLTQFGIPKAFWTALRASMEQDAPSLMGRMDWAYDGTNAPKLFEYNAEVPGAIFESGRAQYEWLIDQQARNQLSPAFTQFNLLEPKLIEAFEDLKENHGVERLHFACSTYKEDILDTSYLFRCAKHASIDAKLMALHEIGIDPQEPGRFFDFEEQPVDVLYKCYPFCLMMEDRDGHTLADAPPQSLLEPMWKMLMTHKGILAVLWDLFPGHPNLLPTYWGKTDHPLTRYVIKPVHGLRGEGIHMIDQAPAPRGMDLTNTVSQAHYPLPNINGRYVLTGSWVVGDEAAGICFRDDPSNITTGDSRFVPHIVI